MQVFVRVLDLSICIKEPWLITEDATENIDSWTLAKGDNYYSPTDIFRQLQYSYLESSLVEYL